MEEIVCKIHGIVYSNKETGYCVMKVAVNGRSAHLTVKGSFPGVNFGPGLQAKFKGRYERHPTYGNQFHASFYELLPEKGKSGIVAYLVSHVKSIGPLTASRMYEVFGDDLLDVLENDPDQIKTLGFLSKRQIEALLKEWNEASESRTASIFLMEMGLSSSQIKSAYTMFGSQTKQEVLKNPYRLHECPGIGFPTADTVARKLGIGTDDPRRTRAMVAFIMEELSRSEGHMFVTSGQIKAYVERLFRRHSIEPFTHGEYLSDSALYSSLRTLEDDGRIVSDGDNIYLRHLWEYEIGAAEAMRDMISDTPDHSERMIDSMISAFEKIKGIQLSGKQRSAVQMLKSSRVCVVSGYPGTGKTTIVSAFVHIFEEMNLDYVLLSPTGIAAKRLSQVTGKAASTIHRALGYNGREWTFHRSNKFIVDAVIVDECSMVDGETFYRLVSALQSSTILVLVGDSAQLPSVGAGHVFRNLIDCESIPGVSLTRIYRQEDESDIVKVAHAILNGDDIDPSFDEKSEFVFLPMPQEKVLPEISKVTALMKERRANFQVIAPMYDGELGVNNLNRELRSVLNSSYSDGTASKMKHGDVDMYEGDRVMIIRNDYDRMVFNGDVGKVQRLSIKRDEVDVRVFDWFDNESVVPRYVDKTFTFKVDEAKTCLRVAYAVTSHKCQGQEFDYVVIPMTMQYGIMLYRNLIYTAITRAKKKVFLFGDMRAFMFAVRNERQISRNSNLSHLIAMEDTERDDRSVACA